MGHNDKTTQGQH